MHPNDYLHPIPKSVPVCPKLYGLFYLTNIAISHRIRLLMKNNNIHIYMSSSFHYQEENRRNKCGQVWEVNGALMFEICCTKLDRNS